MIRKRGQDAGSAAAFVAIITVIIILYILFLPPDVRTELLGDSYTGGSNGSTDSYTTVLLKQNVGKVSYVSSDEHTYDLPTVRVYSPTSGQVLKNIPSISLKHATFDHEKATYTMDLDMDRDATENVLLSFNVLDHNGPISITLNGREIFNSEISSINPKPIVLDHQYLMDSNTLVFSVPSPGLKFWSSNKYNIENLQVTGDVTDYSNSVGIEHFVISNSEKENLESIKLFFYPSCEIKDVGSLKIDLNGRTIYNSVADCGTKMFAVLDNDDVVSGSNELKFQSVKGSYLLDNINIKTTMEEPTYQTYYFELNSDYFGSRDIKADCGDYDNQCPSGCDESQDADCCFARDGYWCALPTLNANDRCRFYVASDDCSICKTGFYDQYDDAPDACEDTCGDNNDDKCTGDCPEPNRYYDKDCCFAQSSDNYWCKETPITGISDKCKPSISYGECDLCPSGYENEDGDSPKACDSSNVIDEDEEYFLSDKYELKLIVRFIDDKSRKKVDLNINGRTFRIDTTSVEYTKVLNDYARSDTNSIEIIPVDDDVNIVELKVQVRQLTK